MNKNFPLSRLDKPQNVPVHAPEVHGVLPRHEVRNRRRRELRTLPSFGVPTKTTRAAHPVPNRDTIQDPAAS